MSEICNGYQISKNLGAEIRKGKMVGRKYEVSDSNGVLFTTTESKRKALDFAESLPTGDISNDSNDSLE